MECNDKYEKHAWGSTAPYCKQDLIDGNDRGDTICHERHTFTPTQTLDQSEKSTQNTKVAAQWIETIKTTNTRRGPSTPTENKNHQTSQDLLDGNDREDRIRAPRRRDDKMRRNFHGKLPSHKICTRTQTSNKKKWKRTFPDRIEHENRPKLSETRLRNAKRHDADATRNYERAEPLCRAASNSFL